MNQYPPPTGGNQPRPQPGPHGGQAPPRQQPWPHGGQVPPHSQPGPHGGQVPPHSQPRPHGGQVPPQQWGYSPATARRPAPTTALYRLGIVIVTLLLVSGVVDGAGWLSGRLAHGDGAVLIGLALGVMWVVLRLALVGVGIAGMIVGSIAFVRMENGRARVGALLLTLAAGMCALGTTVSGSGDLPDAVRIFLGVVEVMAIVIPLVMGTLGLLWLRAGRKTAGGQGS